MVEILKNDLSDFEGLKEWEYKEHFYTLKTEYGDMNIHYIDEGSSSENTVLLLHGEPDWGYIYRKFIDPLVATGVRVVVPDLPGFGKSDKLSERSSYTYEKYVNWMETWMKDLELNNITLFGQDWGGLIGLRLVAENEDMFKNVVVSNTALPTGDISAGKAFEDWKNYAQTVENFHAGGIIKGGTVKGLDQYVIDAYNAPFPDDSYKEAARQFPMLVPVTPDNPSSQKNREAWEMLKNWNKPFLCVFSEQDQIFNGVDKAFTKLIPGCQNQPHKTIQGGHFIQEDNPEECIEAILHVLAL
ncbi:MAG: haloalkane dehalogenase [Candidatus Actinomarina sp.]|nr:haloalkane dehalogenase [Candidatus Actinomarina sp.]MBL6836935.1 haloalkane dehalogenase [Candidatus Actinomarina sp.]